MTKKINTFAKAIRARHDAAVKADKLSVNNRKSLLTFAAEIEQSETLTAFLSDQKLDVACFERDVYQIDKIRNLSLLMSDMLSLRDLNEMTRLVFLTALNFTLANVEFTRQDAYNACSAHCKITDKLRKSLTVQNSQVKSDTTCAAQHRSSLAALENLNILKAANKRVFKIDLENAATIKLAAMLNVSLDASLEKEAA